VDSALVWKLQKQPRMARNFACGIQAKMTAKVLPIFTTYLQSLCTKERIFTTEKQNREARSAGSE
jgi:hypothetical protein